MSFDLAAITDSQTGSLVQGTAKLAQRVILELFTELGSIPYRATRGTSFLTNLRNRRFAAEFDVLVSLAQALVTLRRNLRGDELASDPLDEKLGSVKASKLTLVPGALIMSLLVTSQAGTDQEVSTAVEIVM